MTEATSAPHSGDLPEVPDFPMSRGCPLDPAPMYTRLRTERPVTQVALPSGQKAWLVTSYAHVRALVTDPRISSDHHHPNLPLLVPLGLSEEGTQGGESQAMGNTLVGLDPPEHSAPRRMVIAEFTVRRIQELRPRITEIVESCIDDLIAAGPGADLVGTVAVRVPSMVLSELLGVHPPDREFFHTRTSAMLSRASTPEERRTAMIELATFIDGLIREKEQEPTDDVLGRLVVNNRETGVFTHMGLIQMAYLLLVAGNETTANMIALGTTGLLENPEVVAELIADPSRIGRTVEELLRYFTISDVLLRTAREDIEIDGVTIRKDDGVLLGLGSANRDETVFDSPDRLDIHRGARHHMAFGYGIHQCLGQNLARAELEIVFTTLFARLPGLRLAVPVSELPFKQDSNTYGLHELPVTW
ncbi:cytochrome P450 [Kitasatospora sp. NPDC098652]|uniref:cytochrome P450 n=1 Tax=Kitasatospora sp. NPDC098652 TaxID=3364095 RepID=UPI0037F731A5